MSDNKHHPSKKDKKLAQILKNRRFQRVNIAEEEHARGRDLEKEREEKLKKQAAGAGRAAAAKQKKEAEPAWSARMQQLRDKNTGRMRMADDRWNRFAGTEGGGGRGL